MYEAKKKGELYLSVNPVRVPWGSYQPVSVHFSRPYFPYNFQDRLQPLPFGETKVQFYTPSLEDLVIAKLCSFRDTNKADVESEAVRNSLDWNLLEHLATDEDELKASILNEWRYRDFYIRYQEYVERWRP